MMASFYYYDQNYFRFFFIFKFGSPSEVKIIKALICTRKQNPKGPPEVPIINGPGKPSPVSLKIEVSIVLHLT